MTPGTTPACWAAHMGMLAIRPEFLRGAVAAVKAGTLKERSVAPKSAAAPDNAPRGEWHGDAWIPYYTMAGDGVAVIRISGPTAKGWGKFGEHSTAFTRRAVRIAVHDAAVGSILLLIDSPGGYVAGNDDVAREVEAANAMKPVVAYVEDECCSAAYWIASQASKVYANPSAEIGSIGVFQVIEDYTKQAEIAGIVVHVLTTGPLKGAGVPGAPITAEQLAAWQKGVDEVFEMFGSAVRKGRNLSAKQFEAVATGGVWHPKEARDLGLIDGVRSLDAAISGMPKPKRPRAAAAAARIGIAKAR